MFLMNALFRRRILHSVRAFASAAAASAATRTVLLGALLSVLMSANAFAAFSSNVTLSSSLNPSTVVDNVTFTAVAHSSAYDFRQPLGFGLSANQTVFLRYDLSNATFLSTVGVSQLTDVTTPANVLAAIVAQGGGVGDAFVVFQITAGATGVPFADIFSFVTPGLNTPVVSTAAISYSLHGTSFSAAGATPNNTAVLISTGPFGLSGLLTTVVPTGTFAFQVDSVSIPGCAAVPLVNATAQCTTIVATAGNRAIAVNYSGDGNYAASGGTLAGGQVVHIALNATVPAATYKTPYTFTFTATGSVGTTVFSALDPLPVGLSLSAAGVLSGTPTVTGSGSYRIAVLDANGSTGLQSYLQIVNPAPQTITFTLPPSVYAGTQIPIGATVSSGLVLNYTINTPNVCAVVGNKLRFIGVGSCSVVANQAGNVFYAAANSVLAATVVQAAVSPHEIRIRSSQAQAQSQTGRLANGQIQFTADTDPGAAFRLLATVDFDGNHTMDLLYQNTTQGVFGDVRVWKDFLPANDSLLRNVKLVWDVQAVGDLDGDGFGDLVWRYMQDGTPDTGVSYVWFSNGNAISEVRKRGGAPLSWTLLGARDLNDDGAADMVYLSPDGQIRVLMATAGRSCANFAAGSIPAGYTALRLADFTGNQHGDILIRNATTGDVRLLMLDATALTLPPSTANPNDPNASCTSTTAVVANTVQVMPSTQVGWTLYATADFSGKGIADIVWRQPDGTLTLWAMAAGGVPNITANVGTAPAGFTVFQP